MYSHPYDVILDLKKNPSRLKKISILKEAIKEHPILAKIFTMAYHVGIRFHIKKIPAYHHDENLIPKSLSSCLYDLNNLSTRTLTGHNAINYLASLLSATDEKSAKLLELIVSKDLDCGVTAKTINKVIPKLIPSYPVMLCTEYSKKAVEDFTLPAYSQPKHDGMRINIHVNRESPEIIMFVRKGTTIDTIPPQFKDLAQDAPISCVLDGELMVWNEDRTEHLSRKEGNGILNKLTQGTATEDEISRVCAVVWDMIPLADFWIGKYDVSYQDRFARLKNFNLPTDIAIAETIIVNSIEEAKAHYQSQIDLEREGSVLKTFLGKWKDGRPKYQLKFKEIYSMEMVIIELIEGTGKYKGRLGAFRGTAKKITANVGGGFTDKEREDFFRRKLCGRIMTVEYNKIITDKRTNEKSLYLPRFIELREDI